MKRMAALLSFGAMAVAPVAMALGPTANPAEALDEAACAGLPFTTFVAGDRPVTVDVAKVVPRDRDLPSHCHVTARIGDVMVVDLRMPIAPWTDVLMVSTQDQRAALVRGDAVVWSTAPAILTEQLGRDIVRVYYGRPPQRVVTSDAGLKSGQ